MNIQTRELVARRMLLAQTKDVRYWQDTLSGLLGRGADPDTDEMRIIADALAESREALRDIEAAMLAQPLPVYPFPITEAEARLLDGNR